MGYEVGYRLIELWSLNHERFSSSLDCVKFLCKEIWIKIFNKQMDKLQTNHRGVYVLQDFSFRWLHQFSGHEKETKSKALLYLIFPCGLIRGILSNLGVSSFPLSLVCIAGHPKIPLTIPFLV